MKLNMKMIAIAAAMVAAAGSADAALISQNTGNSSVMLYAFNSVTNAYYVRDLGLQLNSFLPSSITTLPGDGGVTGDKTPAAGLTLDKATNANFADQSAFTTWLSGQSSISDVRWSLFAGDTTTTGANGVARLLIASTADVTTSNGLVRNANAGGTGTQAINSLSPVVSGVSATGATIPGLLAGNSLLIPGTLASIGQAASVFYFAATTQTGSSAVAPLTAKYQNATGDAVVLLASNGDFSYTLAGEAPAAVPVPAAAWLLGSGLMGLGGMIRRRKAAAQA